MFKRAIYAVKGRMKQNLVLLFVMFIIASLVLAALSINKASDEAVDYARESLGAEVSIIPNMENLREQMQGLSREEMREFGRPSAYMSDIEKLMSSEYAIDAKYSVSINALPGNFEISTSSTNNMDFGMKMGSGMNSDSVKIESCNAFSLLKDVVDGNINLIEGNDFDETTVDSVVINDELAILNDFEIGDTIELLGEEETSYEYEIIGIYESVEGTNANTIYTNFSSAEKLMNESTYNDGDYKVDSVTIYVNDPANVEKFIEEGSDLVGDLEDRNLELTFNDSMYELMVGPIESVGDFSVTILYIVVIAGIVIISLIVYGAISSRNYEIGVLLSLGEKKVNIIVQFVVELLIVFIIASSLTIVTSNFIASSIGDSLLENQVSMNEEKASESTGISGRTGGMGMKMFNQSTTADVDIIDEIDVTVTITEYRDLLFSGLIIILIAMLFPVINIFKYSPKEILTRKE